MWCNIEAEAAGEIWHWSLSGVKGLTGISTDSDCCTFAPKSFGKLPGNTISRNYKISNKRLLLCTEELLQNLPLWSQGRKALWLQAREELLSNWKRMQSSKSRVSCERNTNCCFARCAAVIIIIIIIMCFKSLKAFGACLTTPLDFPGRSPSHPSLNCYSEASAVPSSALRHLFWPIRILSTEPIRFVNLIDYAQCWTSLTLCASRFQRRRDKPDAWRVTSGTSATAMCDNCHTLAPASPTRAEAWCCQSTGRSRSPHSFCSGAEGREWTPRKYVVFCRAVTSILSQRLLHKMTNSRAVLIARLHVCETRQILRGEFVGYGWLVR